MSNPTDRVRLSNGALYDGLCHVVTDKKPEHESGHANEAADDADPMPFNDVTMPPTPPICDFLIGYAGERCKRCGASWLEHYPRPQG